MNKDIDYNLNYRLTREQKKASEFIIRNIQRKKDCAISAVCGAGKSEIIYDLLRECLQKGKKVGIATPRKDVVCELKKRIQKDFINAKVIGVHGDNCDELEGDIIIFTTHQAFRFNGYFKVLVVDEVDAFPYKDNEVLQCFIKKASELFIYLSATMPSAILKNEKIQKYYLNKRYHGFPLVEPCFIKTIWMVRTLKKELKRLEDKVVLVFFPTIKMQMEIAKKIKTDKIVINSKTANRGELLSKIKRLKKGVVFTTTVLERGITISDVQVIVYNSDHQLFQSDILIQISGRVGRNKNFPSGNIVFICSNISKSMKKARKEIKKCNE